MTDTPNKRLARMLETLARVAAKGDKGCLAVDDAMHFALKDDMERAEACATEAARLAGVPVDGWYTSEPTADGDYLVQISGFAPEVLRWSSQSRTWEGQGARIANSAIFAHHALPEPYRPEEKTDGAR